MPEPRRARRRRDKARMKAKARRIRPYAPHADKAADHLQVCSGPCCGNPRRWLGEPTMQERRAALAGADA